MFFETTDDRIKKLEKRADELEKQMNRTLSTLNDALLSVTDVVTKLYEENNKLKKEKKLITSSQKKIEKEIKQTGIRENINGNLTTPVKNAIKENMELIQEVAKEGWSDNASAEALRSLVEKEGEVRMRDAAETLKVHEVQIEHWAEMLKDQKIITISEKGNKKYLCAAKMVKR
jgi:hypothetical protein